MILIVLFTQLSRTRSQLTSEVNSAYLLHMTYEVTRQSRLNSVLILKFNSRFLVCRTRPLVSEQVLQKSDWKPRGSFIICLLTVEFVNFRDVRRAGDP